MKHLHTHNKAIYVTILVIAFIVLVDTLIGGLVGQIVMCLAFSILIFIGKGDFLIAGYNTASEEEKEKYHTKRIRIVLGTSFLLLACLTALRTIIGTTAMFIGIGIVLISTLILANTWTKK